MKLTDRHRISVFLMAASLALLAAFLFLFLKKAWQDEVAALKKETGYLFVNAVRGIEGEMLDKLVFRRRKHPGGEGGADSTFFRLPAPPHSDSVKILAFFEQRDLRLDAADSNFKISVHAEQGAERASEMTGSLSMIVALDGEESDSIFVKSDRKDILPLLEKNFSQAVADARLPVRWRIVHLPGPQPSSIGGGGGQQPPKV